MILTAVMELMAEFLAAEMLSQAQQPGTMVQVSEEGSVH